MVSSAREKPLAYVLLIPAMTVLFGLIGFPFVYAIFLSFTQKIVGRPLEFVGLANYVQLINDRVFWITAKNSVVYTVFAVAGKVVMGTILAELLNKQLIGRQILRGLFLLPWVIPTFITAYTWQWLLNDFGGIINVFFEAIPGITNSPSWLSDPSWAMPTVIAVNVWRGTPFIAIPLLAGMQGIPKDLYESAAVDGASGLQKFFHITVPSLRSVYTVITLLTAIFTLNDFELVYILTRGGPVNSTKIFSILSYEYAFASNDLGLGTAVSLLFAPLVLILMILALKYIYKGGGEV